MLEKSKWIFSQSEKFDQTLLTIFRWYNELRLGQVAPDPLIPPGDDEGSDDGSVYDHDAV